MLIQQTPTEIIIRIPADVQIDGLQRLIDFLLIRCWCRCAKAPNNGGFFDTFCKKIML